MSALRDAALELLAEIGYDRLSIDAVAARAKASKMTIYRRWSGKAELVVDALSSLRKPGEVPDTGSLRGDLEAMAEFQLLSNRLIDQPFSIRYRLNDGFLTVREVKFGTIGLKDEKDELAGVKVMAVGRYRQAGTGGKERPW